MKIFLFDLTCTQPLGGKFHGGGLYGEVVFFRLIEKFPSKDKMSVLYYSDSYINPQIVKICHEKRIEMIDMIGRDFDEIIKKISPNLYFTSLPTKKRIVHSAGTQMVTICHDLRTTEIYFDQYSYMLCRTWKDYCFLFDSIFFNGKFQKLNMIRTAKKYIGYSDITVFTVSNHTKYHLISLFPKYQDKKIPVFYSPNYEQIKDKVYEEIGELPERVKGEKYFLLVSGSIWIKNALRSMVALDRMFTTFPEINMKVVVTGVHKEDPFRSKIKNVDKFIFLPYVDRSILNALHKNAYVFIYPSLGEGFGYAPMDSLKYEVPVIASSISSIPEICGDAVLYTNPYSIQEIENRCLQMLDETIYNDYKSRCKKQFIKVSNIQKEHLEYLINVLLKPFN